MPAHTPWFDCGECGFRNKPRVNAQAAKAASPRLNDAEKKDDAVYVCEQCGAPNDIQFAADYKAGA